MGYFFEEMRNAIPKEDYIRFFLFVIIVAWILVMAFWLNFVSGLYEKMSAINWSLVVSIRQFLNLRTRERCFPPLFPEGRQTRKHCFLAMFPEGGQTRKNCFLVMFPEGRQTSNHCFPAMFHEGDQTRKHCFLAMFSEGRQTRKHCCSKVILHLI